MERKVVQIDYPLAEQIQFKLNSNQEGDQITNLINEEAFWTGSGIHESSLLDENEKTRV